MKTSKHIIYAVVLWTLVECRHAGRLGRSLDVAGSGSNLTQKQQQEVIHADVLQHFTSTPTPPSEKNTDAVQEATSSFIKDVPFIPEEINVQNLKNDDHLHVTYDRKITIDKENPTEDSADVKNKTAKSQTNDVISYNYNQTGPSSSVNSEVVLSRSSYEHSSTSVVYDEEDEENEETHTQGFRPIASSDAQKSDSERKTYEVKKKGGKKEIPDSATVPTDYSGAGRIEKPYKDNTISVKLKDKKESISEALDGRRSTTIRISNSSSVSFSEQDNKHLGSLDILKVGLSDTNNEESVNQSVNSVINANGVNSDTKKPRVKYSVKKSQDVVTNNTVNDSSSAVENQLREATKNNVPVLSLEPQSTPPTVGSTTAAVKILNPKQYPHLQRRHPTESSPTKLDILGKFATPSTTTIVKPSIAFKQQLANKLKGLEPAPTIPMNVSEDTTDENPEKTGKSSTKSNLRKKPKLDHPEMYIPPTATAWTLVSMKMPAEGLVTSRKPAIMLANNSSTPISRSTLSTLRPTTIIPVTRVKSFVPWSTRLQKTTKPPSTVSGDDVTSLDNTAAFSDSSMSSSSSNEHVQKTSESLNQVEFLSSASTPEEHSVIRTTLELERNMSETASNLIQPSLNDVMVKDQSSTVSQENAKSVRGATTERLAITSSPSAVVDEPTPENSTPIEVEGRIAEKENIIETKQSSEESDPGSKAEEKLLENKEETEIPVRTNNTANEVTLTDGSDGLKKIKSDDQNQNFSQTLTTVIPISEVLDTMKIKNMSDISELDPGASDILVDGVEDGKSGEESEEDLKPKQTTTLPPMFEPFETTVIPDLEEDVDGESEREDEELSVMIDKLSNNQTATDNSTKINEMDMEVKSTTASLPVANNVNTTGTYVTSFDIVSKENTTQVVTKTPSEGDINWYNIDTKPLNASEAGTSKRPVLTDATTTAEVESTIEPEITTEMSIQETTVLPETTHTVTLATSTISAPISDPTVDFEDGTNFDIMEDPTSCVRIVVHVSPLKLCHGQQQLRESIASQLATNNVSSDQILIMSKRLQDCGANPSTEDQHLEVDVCFVNKLQEPSPILRDEFLKLYTKRANDPSFPIVEVQMIVPPTMSSGFDNVLAAIILSVIAAVCLVLLGILLVIIRKRQGKFNYGQRCTPVSLDDYSLDNISVYNSVRRKGALRASKRSYGNPAFDDPGGPTHTINFAGLANFSSDRDALDEEFNQIPMITVKPDELPPGAESKNRYANVIPLPETRVPLTPKEGSEPLYEYINANYIKGLKGQEKLYIACQAPLQSTIEDFWRMVWQQQTKVILMLTALNENGVEKCADYLPQLEITDCHRLFGDFQVTLKKHEVREKYIISSLQLKNLETNLWREVTHLWYSSWPPQGVPEDGSAMIAFLIEARSYMRGAQGPTVVHCSPGTGRTGTVIAIDLCIRDFETLRSVDIPKTVYALRRDRAGAVQTKDQYAFIYQVLNLYATKLTGGALDSI